MNPSDGGRERRNLNAVLLLDKPGGVTSNAALQRAKRLLKASKAGHAGTLDPLASGLLPVLLGEATKFAGDLLAADKEYVATLQLGVSTTTGDIEGEVVERRAVKLEPGRIESALAGFRGPIDQVPPMYSALKHAGRPLYALAREGRTVARAPRQVTIHALEMLDLNGDSLEILIRCSKGTYVRTLAEDLGRALGTGACVAALRRTRTAGFGIDQAVPLGTLEQAPEPARGAWLLPVDSMLRSLPRVDLAAGTAERFGRGQAVRADTSARGRCRVYGPEGTLLGVGMVLEDHELRPIRLVARRMTASG